MYSYEISFHLVIQDEKKFICFYQFLKLFEIHLYESFNQLLFL